MKKRIAILITVFCSIAVLAVIFFLFCNTSSIKKNYRNISDYRYVALRYACDGYTLNIISGVRETPYELDGKCADGKTEYTVFTVIPASDFDASNMALHAAVKGTEYDLVLSRHPFKNSYSTEISTALDEDTAELTLTVNGENVTAAAPIVEIDGDRALAIAFDSVDTGKGEYEIYLRISENTVTAAGGWYWYVAFVYADRTDSVLINAENGEVAAIRSDQQ